MEIPSLEENNDEPKLSIPQEVTELSQEDEVTEAQPFNISFIKYNPKECEIDSIKSDNAKAALIILRDVGCFFSNQTNYSKKSSKNISILPVIRAGEYLRLYKGLFDDEEIKEIKYQNQKKRVDIRVFFSSLEKQKTLYIIAVRETHYDTSKGNRV